MRKLIILALALVFPVICYASHFQHVQAVIGAKKGGGGAEPVTKWVGFPNTAGTPSAPTGTWTGYGLDADRAYAQKWTATENGTIQSINFHWGTPEGNPTVMFFAVWRNTTLIGYVDNTTTSGTYSSNAWSGYTTITVVGGQSLDFSTNDVIYFGYTCDETGSYLAAAASQDTGGAEDIWFDNTTVLNNVPAATVTWAASPSASKSLGVILQYVTR